MNTEIVIYIYFHIRKVPKTKMYPLIDKWARVVLRVGGRIAKQATLSYFGQDRCREKCLSPGV